jgi:protein-S-isoprenylcysteine O-methyltransferase
MAGFFGLKLVGLIMMMSGEALRKVSMIVAGRSFTHFIRTETHADHALVTWGPYSLLRHPGYTGWFIWSVSSQLLLLNPISIVAYAVVSWMFFADRIPYEEAHLRQLFGPAYVRYARKVPHYFPGVPSIA